MNSSFQPMRENNIGIYPIWFSFLALFLLSLDYRSDVGTGKLFLYFTSFTALGLLGLSFLAEMKKSLSHPLLLCWLLFLPLAVAVAAISGNNVARFGSHGMPIALFVAAIGAGFAATQRGLNYEYLIKVIFSVALVNMFWRAYYALFVMHIGIDQMRYQILPSGAIIVLSLGISRYFFSSRFPWYYTVILIPVASAIAVSVTRVYLFSAVVLVSVAIAYTIKGHGPNQASMRLTSLARGALLAGVLLFLVTPLVYWVRPDTFLEWGNRFSGVMDSGFDPTGGLRFAQVSGMFNGMGINPVTWMFGNGLGSVYTLDTSYLSENFDVDEMQSTLLDMLVYGGLFSDTTWMSMVFQGGLVFFSLGAWVIIFLFKAGSRLTRRHGVSENLGIDLMFLAIGCLCVSFTVNILMGRLSNVMLGMLVGVALAHFHRRAERARLECNG